jgi:hypothetical protein
MSETKTKEHQIMNAKAYNTYGRPATAAELANPGVARYKFYDPERPSDDPDEVIRLQRQRTFAQSRWNGQQEALRARIAAETAPAKVTAAPRQRRVQPAVVATSSAVPVAAACVDGTDFPMHMVNMGDVAVQVPAEA